MVEFQEPHAAAIVARPEPRMQRRAEWSPTLEGGDLACLLRVIESELLPRLVEAYAPSKHSPLRASGRG